MKSSEFILNVTAADLANTLEDLENGNEKYLSIGENLFLIKNINTCLRIKTNTSLIYKGSFFKFSYNDDNFKNMIVIRYIYQDTNCLKFLDETDFITKEQLQAIKTKSFSIAKKNNSYMTVEDSINHFDDMVYNEALMLITSAINRDDFELVKNDFETKYEAWKTRRNAENEKAVELLEQLYNKLLKIKLSEKI